MRSYHLIREVAQYHEVDLLAFNQKASIASYFESAHSGEVNFRVGNVDSALKRVQEHFSDGALSKLDGVSIDYENWWFNLRASNTEPLVRLNLEADTRSLMEAGVQQVSHLLEGI